MSNVYDSGLVSQYGVKLLQIGYLLVVRDESIQIHKSLFRRYINWCLVFRIYQLSVHKRQLETALKRRKNIVRIVYWWPIDNLSFVSSLFVRIETCILVLHCTERLCKLAFVMKITEISLKWRLLRNNQLQKASTKQRIVFLSNLQIPFSMKRPI